MLFYRYAVKFVPSNTIRIPLKVFSRFGPDGMIRLPTSEEEAAHIGETFPDDNSDENVEGNRFHDEGDDDIPPPVKRSKAKMQENEEDFFDVSDGEEEEDGNFVNDRSSGLDEATKPLRA